MENILATFLFFTTNRWGVIFVFFCLLIAGIVVDRRQKKKGMVETEKPDLDKAVASYSGMNPAPWQENDENNSKKKGKVETFYTGKNKRLSNMRTIIYKEDKIMKERSEKIAERDYKTSKEDKNKKMKCRLIISRHFMRN